jgi:hypothetical protein
MSRASTTKVLHDKEFEEFEKFEEFEEFEEFEKFRFLKSFVLVLCSLLFFFIPKTSHTRNAERGILNTEHSTL